MRLLCRGIPILVSDDDPPPTKKPLRELNPCGFYAEGFRTGFLNINDAPYPYAIFTPTADTTWRGPHITPYGRGALLHQIGDGGPLITPHGQGPLITP